MTEPQHLRRHNNFRCCLTVLHKLKPVIHLADGLAEEHWQLQAARIGRVSFLQESASWWVVCHPVDVPIYIKTKETGLSGLQTEYVKSERSWKGSRG